MGQIKNSYDPNRRPTTPSALDDEFDDGALDVKWTEWNLGSAPYTITEKDGLLHVNVPTNTPFELAGIYQALPGGFGDFTVVTKVSIIGETLNYQQGGLMIMQGITNTSDVTILTLSYRAATGPIMIYQGNLTDYLGGAGSTYPQTYGAQVLTTAWFRFRRSGTTMFKEWSIDGIGWSSFNRTAESFTPAQVGIWWGNDNSGQTFDIYFEFFRYKTSNDSGLIGSW